MSLDLLHLDYEAVASTLTCGEEGNCSFSNFTLTKMEPSAELGILKGADGSASFSSNGISVLASVNGPLEVQRRDEIPDEAAIEVVVRPAAGVGSKVSRPAPVHIVLLSAF